MPQIINTNIPSLNSQRNLNSSQNDVATSLQRLSSGLRINSAKDDAAGLAISERFTAQIRGLNQAARNANDGISLAQTAEGDLAQITNNLQRIRELAVQAANATNSSSDRIALQQEVTELVAEIDRVAQQSNFNGVNLLDGSFSAQQFQVGANAGQTITVSDFASARTADLGQSFQAASTPIAVATQSTPAAANAGLASNELIVNGNDVGVVATGGAGDSYAQNIANAVEIADGQVTATVGAASFTTGAFTEVGNDATGGTYTLSIDGVVIVSEAVSNAAEITTAELDAILLASNGITDSLAAQGITVTGSAAAGYTLTKADGSNIEVVETFAGAGIFDAAAGLANVSGATITGTSTALGFGSVALTSDSDITVAGSAPADAGLVANTFSVPTVGTGTTIAGTSVSTVAGANLAIASVDNALTAINGARASLGAVQNRFESVVVSLQTSAENLSAARSRILDADFAAETANLARAQILQQAGIAVLAQANAQPQNVLALLQ